MKNLYLILLCLTFIILVGSCGTGSYTVSSKGDEAEVILKNGSSFSAEMIFISDTAFIFTTIINDSEQQSRLFYSHKNEIKSVSVKGYDGSGWNSSWLLFQALPTVLFTGALISYSDEDEAALTVGLILAIPTILTAVLFGTTEGETPQWSDQSGYEDLNSLKIYSRYPEGLNERDLEKLLNRYNQKSIKKLY